MSIPQVLPPGAKFQKGHAWAGTPPDRCVRELMLFLDCCLSTDYWIRGNRQCDTGLDPSHFIVPTVVLDADSRDLFARVRAALGDRDGALMISFKDYTNFLTKVVPKDELLPYVTTVDSKHYSWFVPDGESKEYAGAMTVDPILRLSVLADAAMHPESVVNTPSGEDGDNWEVFRQLEDIARLISFVQGIRRDSETGGLLVDDRTALYDATVNILRRYRQTGGTAMRASVGGGGGGGDPVMDQIRRIASGLE